MANTISIVARDESNPSPDGIKHIYTYTATTIPRIGEYVQVLGHPPYVVNAVIHTLANGSDNIVVEVNTTERRYYAHQSNATHKKG